MEHSAEQVISHLFSETASSEIPTIQEVEAIDALRHLSYDQPFLLRQNALAVAALPAYSIQNLARKIASRKILVEHKHRWQNSTMRTSAAEFFENLNTTDYYWRQVNLVDLPIQAPDLPVFAQRPDTVFFDHLWVGPAGTIQTFHQDNHDDVIVNSNVFVQMYGIKYVAVASASESEFFQDNTRQPGHSRHSSASPFDPATRKNVPSLAHGVLMPGDLLFIPPSAWHYVESLSPSVSLSRWWFNNRIVETLYLTGKKANPESEISSATGLWSADLAQLGGFGVLLEFLNRLTPSQKYVSVLALLKRYGSIPEFT